ILWAKKWDELAIGPKRWIMSQVGGNLLGLVLENQSSRRFYGMVVRQRQINGLIKADQGRILSTARSH
ncbi:MAG: hypothetical protein WAN65_16500, partial [Candidatus Sulfotelmatobacter sp.]